MAVDVQGKMFVVGQKVARAYLIYAGEGPACEIARVTRVEGEKVYLNDSKRAMTFPERLAIIE